MAGFAEGFASGYGLMDATLQHQKENQLKQKALDTEERHYKDTNEREARRDAQHAAEYDKNFGLQEKTHQATQAYYEGRIKNDDAELQLKNRKQEADEKLNNAELGIKRLQAQGTLASAQASINYHKAAQNAQEWELNQKKSLIDRQNAMQEIALNHLDPKTRQFIDPKTPQEAARLMELLPKAGVNVDSMLGNPKQHAESLSKLTELGKLMPTGAKDGYNVLTEKDNPEYFKAIHDVYGSQMTDQVGDGNPSRITSIHSHQTPNGIVYTLGHTGADGTEQPLSQYGDNTKTKWFTGDQFANSLIAHGQAFNLSQKPQIQNLLGQLNNKEGKEEAKGNWTAIPDPSNPNNSILLDKISGRTKPINATESNSDAQALAAFGNALKEAKATETQQPAKPEVKEKTDNGLGIADRVMSAVKGADPIEQARKQEQERNQRKNGIKAGLEAVGNEFQQLGNASATRRELMNN